MSHHLPALLAVFTHPDDVTFRPGEPLLLTPDELTVVCDVEMRCAYEPLRLIFGSITPRNPGGGQTPSTLLRWGQIFIIRVFIPFAGMGVMVRTVVYLSLLIYAHDLMDHAVLGDGLFNL
jgi:hypothetical protein